MARLRHKKALEARLDKLERTISAVLAQKAPKPQDRAKANALIRQSLEDRLDWYLAGEKGSPPPLPKGYEAAVDLMDEGDAAVDVAKVRAELKASINRMAESKRQAEVAARLELARDMEEWAAQLNALADQLLVPHAHQAPEKDHKVVPIAEAPSRREPNFIGFGEPDEHWRPSPWRIE